MLNTAADYEYLSVGDFAERITGNIMPVRAPTLSDTATLRLEDVLFLTEAHLERMNVLSAPDNSIPLTAPSRAARGINLSAIRLTSTGFYNGRAIYGPKVGYSQYMCHFINPDTSFPAQHVDIGYSAYDLGDYLSGYSLSAPEESMPYFRMRPGASNPELSDYVASLMFSDYIRAKFWTYDKMRKLVTHLRLGDFATEAKQITYKEDGTVEYEYTESLNNTILQYPHRYANGSHGTYLSRDIVATYKSTFESYHHVKSAKLIYHININNGGNDFSNIWSSISLTINRDGSIKIPGDLIHTLIDEGKSIAGGTYKSTEGLGYLYLYLEFDFPAVLDGTGWGWEPFLSGN